MASNFIFPPGGGQTGLDSLRIKNALVDSFLPNKINAIVNNQLKNPSFYESIASALAKGFLLSRGEVQQKNSLDIQNKAFNLFPEEQEIFERADGVFNNVLLIPNLSLTSNFTQINFFDTKDNVETDPISIDIPLCTLSYSYSNKYTESTPVGYNGTIKELVGTSNLSIKIEGVFTSRYLGIDTDKPTQNMPNVRDFQLMCMRNKIVTVDSKFIADNTILNDFFEDCVVKNFSLPGDNTSKNLQRFTLTLESDKPLDII